MKPQKGTQISAIRCLVLTNKLLGYPILTYTQVLYIYILTEYKSYVGLVSGELIRSKRKHITYHIRLDVA